MVTSCLPASGNGRSDAHTRPDGPVEPEPGTWNRHQIARMKLGFDGQGGWHRWTRALRSPPLRWQNWLWACIMECSAGKSFSAERRFGAYVP
jgi:hypothetical protein